MFKLERKRTFKFEKEFGEKKLHVYKRIMESSSKYDQCYKLQLKHLYPGRSKRHRLRAVFGQ